MVFKHSATSEMEFFTNIVDGLHPFTFFAKRSILYSILEVLNSTLIMQDVFKTSSVRLHQDECLLGCSSSKFSDNFENICWETSVMETIFKKV